jgi:hypothetical protein
VLLLTPPAPVLEGGSPVAEVTTASEADAVSGGSEFPAEELFRLDVGNPLPRCMIQVHINKQIKSDTPPLINTHL